MDLSVLLTVSGVTGAVFFLGYLALRTLDHYQLEVEARLQALPQAIGRTPGGASQRLPLTVPFPLPAGLGWLSIIGRLLPRHDKDLRPYRQRLIRAGFSSPRALSAFFAARLMGMVVPAAVGSVAYYFGLVDQLTDVLLCGSLAAFGFIVPSLWLDRQVTLRQEGLRRALPDFLDLMIVCLESGLSLPGTIRQVGDEISLAHPQLAGELELVQRDMVLGSPLDVSFRQFGERTGLDAVRTLSTFIHQSRRLGTELVGALRSQADLLRYEQEQNAEEQAQKAAVKILFPMLLLILPAVFVVLAGPAAIQLRTAFSK